MLPVKSLDELKIYHDFLKKIATEFNGVSEAFMAIDIHREGYITKDELRGVLENFAFKMSKQQFDALMNVMDTNHDGKISYDEFMLMAKGPMSDVRKEKADSVFSTINEDGDASLDLDDLESFFAANRPGEALS